MSETPTPESTPPTAPTPNYDTLTVDQISAWVANAGEKARAAALRYEIANRNRAEVIVILRPKNS